MRLASRVFDGLLDLMAGIACAIVASIFVAIIADVTFRFFGLGALTWVVAVCEYGLLYVACLGAPWLLRERGHVAMEVFRAMLPERLQRIGEKMVCALCLLACATVVYAGWPAAVRAWGVLDERSVYMPRGALFVPVLAGFALLAIQFARVLFGRGTIYAGLSFEQESL